MSQISQPNPLSMVIPVDIDYAKPLTDLYLAYAQLAKYLPSPSDFDKVEKELLKAESAIFRLRVYFNNVSALHEHIRQRLLQFNTHSLTDPDTPPAP